MVAHVWNHGTVEDVVGEYNMELHSKMTALSKQTFTKDLSHCLQSFWSLFGNKYLYVYF